MRTPSGRLAGLAALALAVLDTQLPPTEAPHTRWLEARAALPAKGGMEDLLAVNRSFREAHVLARKEVLRQAGPILLFDGDGLTLVRGDKRERAEVVPPSYQVLKAVSHVPLGAYLLLAPYGEGELSPARLDGLRAYREQVGRAEQALPGLGLPAKALARQREIVAASRQFLDRVLRAQRCNQGEADDFARATAPLVMANAAEAARALLESLHTQVRMWRAQMTAAEWKELRVVIQGSALPRKGNLAAQYFARLLGEPGEGLRVLYAESLYEEGRALNLLAASRVDFAIGAAFFGDGLLMHRDLLGDAAAECLKSMTLEP